MDAFPRTVDGLTMYKHIEANVFPGMNHSIKVQLTKSLANSFMSYFLGDGNKHGEFIYHEMDSGSECSTPQNRRRTYSSSSSDHGLIPTDSNDTSYHSNGEASQLSSHSRKTTSSDGNEKVKRKLLFGGIMNRGKKNEGANKKKKKSTRRKTKKEQQSEEVRSPDPKKQKPYKQEEKSEEIKSSGEIVFVKLWRIGPININLSVAGYNRLVNLKNQGVLVEDFRKAYKIGASNYLIKKLIWHFVGSLAHNAFDIIKNKLGGSKNHHNGAHDEFDIGPPRRILSDLDEGNESDEDQQAILLFTTSPAAGRRTGRNQNPVIINGRRRLYTK